MTPGQEVQNDEFYLLIRFSASRRHVGRRSLHIVEVPRRSERVNAPIAGVGGEISKAGIGQEGQT